MSFFHRYIPWYKIKFQPEGKFLGIKEKAKITWSFDLLYGFKFSSRDNQYYSYSIRENHLSEKYEFLAVFPRSEYNTTYWKVDFPLE